MEAMNPEPENQVSALLRLLLDPAQYERPPLLVSRLRDRLTGMNRADGLAFLERELGNPDRSLHTRSVLLQLAGQLAWPELLDCLRSFILAEVPVQLAKAALRALSACHGLAAYRFCRELAEKCQRPEIVQMAQDQIAVLCREDRAILHFHSLLLGRPSHRDPFSGLEALAARLDREARELLIAPLRLLCGPELAVLSRLAGLCADPLLAGPLLGRLQSDWAYLPADTLQEMLRALCRCVRSSPKAARIGGVLSGLFPQSRPELRRFVLIWSLPLLDVRTRTELFESLPQLSSAEKTALLEAASAADAQRLAPQLLDGLEWETDQTLLELYAAWLLEHGYARACLDRLDRLQGDRSKLLLRALCAGDCRDFHRQLLPYFHAGSDDELLVSLAAGLLKTADRAAARRAWELLQGGVPPAVQSALIRHLPHWFPLAAVPLERLFAVCRTMPGLQGEWLVACAKLLETNRDEDFRHRILDGVMVLFEDQADADPLPFIDFLRRYPFGNEEERRLVCEELQLMINTLLRVSANPTYGRMLAELLRELERKGQGGKVEKLEKV